jgi:adenosylcobinamide-GDP ribazoletransferase
VSWLGELIGAFTLLTDSARCVWAYPVVGAAVGGIGAGVYGACAATGLPPPLSALWTLAALTWVTGALHEDGLADTADGFGGGGSRERKLEIMRDSRIGTYGALALVLAIALRGASLASLARPGPVAAALVAAGALGRGGILVLLLVLRPARPDGLGATLREHRPERLAAGLALAAAAAFALLPARAALDAVSVSLVASLGLAALARRQVGGYSGDVLGAGASVVECAVLSVLAAARAG